MGSVDRSQPGPSRGLKRQHFDNQVIETQDSLRKRRRVDENQNTSYFSKVYQTLRGWCSSILGLGRGEMNNDDDDISIIGESNRRMETVEASEPSTLDMLSGTGSDEVQLVKVVNSAKDFQRGGTSIGRFYGGAYTISTRERRQRDREQRKSQNIVANLRQGSTPSRRFLADPFLPSWRKVLPIEKPSFKRRNTPRECRAVYESVKLDDLAKYKNAYEKMLLCSDPYISRIGDNAGSKTSTPLRGLNEVTASPFLRKPSLFSNGVLSKVELTPTASSSSAKAGPSLVASSQPHVVDLDTEENEVEEVEVLPVGEVNQVDERPLTISNEANSPKAKPSDDDDVIEIIAQYSPRTPAPESAWTPKRVPKSVDSNYSGVKVCSDSFLEDLLEKYDVRKKNSEHLLRQERVKINHCREISERLEKSVEDRLRKHLTITEVVIDEPEEEEEEALALPPITQEMEQVIKSAMTSSGQVLVDAFSIPITRKDLETLRGLNWLNDEVINFYMQMIVERSKSTDNWPTVYATNTFFYPKLLQTGYTSLKRWTRKIDIFAHDLILIPVHLGMHWCLAVVDFKTPGIYYYDSMGGNNDRCLHAIENYLQEEHKDKKKAPYDTTKFEKVNVKEIPQQMNGSDCGMFTCKFAEYISRRAAITFTQEDMPYFRQRMIYEIVKKKLIHP